MTLICIEFCIYVYIGIDRSNFGVLCLLKIWVDDFSTVTLLDWIGL